MGIGETGRRRDGREGEKEGGIRLEVRGRERKCVCMCVGGGGREGVGFDKRCVTLFRLVGHKFQRG